MKYPQNLYIGHQIVPAFGENAIMTRICDHGGMVDGVKKVESSAGDPLALDKGNFNVQKSRRSIKSSNEVESSNNLFVRFFFENHSTNFED